MTFACATNKIGFNMTTDGKQNKKSFIEQILKDALDSFIEGYQKGKKFKEIENASTKDDNDKITTLSKDSVELVLEQMKQKDTQVLIQKIDALEKHIGILQEQIKIFVYNERQSQELIVNLMTTVEVMINSMEEAGIIPSNELQELQDAASKTNNSAKDMNDVMRTDKVFVHNSKKFDLN